MTMLSSAQIGSLLRARNVAVVGATDRSAWSGFIHRNLAMSRSVDRVALVNPNQAKAHGEPTFATLFDVDGPIDLVFVLLRADLVASTLAQAVECGVRNAVVIASGFSEGGPEGQERAEGLRRLAEEHNLALIGPNTLGFVNIADGLLAFAAGLTMPFLEGPIGVATQSGGMASQLLRIARARGVGMATIVGVGNETVISATDVIRYFLEDDRIKVIGTYLEGIRDVAGFRSVAQRALEIGKPIVALKVGRSKAGQRAASSHTGALVGDDGVISAAFDQLGIARVDSLDEFVATTGLLAYAPALSGRRVGIIGSSGGSVGIMAEWAEGTGFEVPELQPQTVQAIDDLLGGYGHGTNPIDATGIVVTDPAIASRLTRVVTADANLDFVVTNVPAPEFFGPDMTDSVRETVATYAQTQATSPIPVALEMDITIDLSPELAAVLRESRTYVSRGIDLTFRAIRRSVDWHDRRAAALRRRDALLGDRTYPRISLPSTVDETAALCALAQAGAPVLPFAHVRSATAAAKSAELVGLPAVVKVVSARLAHKSDIGGVALGLETADAVAAAYDAVVANAAEAVGAEHVDGAIVAPMRSGGVELFVSLSRAGEWGALLTVGLGGRWVEVLHDTVSRLLPLDRDEIKGMFRRLRAASILNGVRGTAAVDLDKVCDAVAGIVAAGLGIGSALESIEVNPLWVRGDQVEALDALITLTPGAT